MASRVGCVDRPDAPAGMSVRPNPLPVALTMGLVTISLLNIVTAMSTRDPERSMFGRYTISNMRFVLLILASLGLTLVVTEIGFLQRIFDTVPLTGQQWGICLLITLIAVAIVEVAKFILRRTRWASTAAEKVDIRDLRPAPAAGVAAVPGAKDMAD